MPRKDKTVEVTWRIAAQTVTKSGYT